MLLLLSKSFRKLLFLAAVGLIGFGLVAPSDGPGAAHAQTRDTRKLGKNEIPPPPEDFNELSMEVAALRTLHLLKAGPAQLRAGELYGRKAGMEPRKRAKADVSPRYRQLLTELRDAFVAGQGDRVEEVSEQLEELAKKEDPDLDDEIEVTQTARENAERWIRSFDAITVIRYLAAYGKDFPSPRQLLIQTMRLDGKGRKPSPEEWKRIRADVTREVTYMLSGINLEGGKQKKKAQEVAELLDRGYALSDEELKKQATRLRGAINRLTIQQPTDIIKHVIELDLAELLSNPRLRPAVEARLKYLAAEAKLQAKG